MENILKLYTYVDGVNDTPFPSEEEQVQIIDFKFDASRMAGAPTIEATVKHRLCLDNLWCDKVYASYRGEKYYVRNTPSSSKDNTDERYSHNVELMSERDVLNHVYFIDAVQGNSGIDKVKSNSPRVQFYGDIKEFVSRLNSSLEYAKLDYTAIIDDGIESEIVNVSFEKKYILDALQESFNFFEIPYYFVGKKIHFGYMENAIPYEMEYGNEGALLSISKENANYKAVNRVSGTGSTENIPYYYPNTSPNGDIYCEPIVGNTGITSSSDITVINPELFASKISVNDVLTCFLFDATVRVDKQIGDFKWIGAVRSNTSIESTIVVSSTGYVYLRAKCLPNVVINSPASFDISQKPNIKLNGIDVEDFEYSGDTITFLAKDTGEYKVNFHGTIDFSLDENSEFNYTMSLSLQGLGFQLVKEGDTVDVYNEKEIGLSFNKQPNSGDKIKQSVKALIPFSQTLMPPVYRETSGSERFYNAKNNTYEIPVEGGYYNFENEYSDNNRKEIIVDFSEIKPSIVGMTNKEGLRIDMFSEFAFDKNDSDEYDSVNNEYLHPYFYGKLRKFDGDYGFNLFDHAQEGSTMTVAMTSGVCGGCNFEIGVGEEAGKNIIQVDGNGDLIYGEDGKVKTGDPQEKQNDTRTNEVWIALKKDDTTYPSFKPMPNATGNLKPSAGDTFVLTGINMPQSYIEKAENDLKEAIIKYMWLNNTDKFNFSIKFSRIFLKEHPEILDKLNENARIVVKYNNSTYTFYVDNFSVNVNSSEPLPEIEVNLVDTLTIGKNSLQNALDSVKQDILSTIGGGDFLKQGLNYFIRKDVDDYANGKLRLKKGADFGTYNKGKSGGYVDANGNSEFLTSVIRELLRSPKFIEGFAGEGWKLWLDENGLSNLEVDNLTVRQLFRVFELIIEKIKSIGGHIIVSAADGKIKSVEDIGDFFKIYFEGDNFFEENDLIRCHVYRGGAVRGYWVEVSSSERDFILVNKSEFLDWGTVPKEGDDCVLMGNTKNKFRKNFISISASEMGMPRIDVLSRVNKKSLSGALRARLGNLDGISDSWFPADNQPKGDGLYSDNAYLRGSFLLVTGEDVKTKFEIIEGKLTSAIEGIRGEDEEKGYLSNPNFLKGLLNWNSSSDTKFFIAGGKWILTPSGILSTMSNGVNVIMDSWRTSLKMRNSFILQKNSDMKSLPEISETSEGKKKAVPVYFTFFYRCSVPGVIRIEFVGVDKTDFEDFESLEVEKEIEISDDYKQFSCEGFWNGTGDFKVSFNGEIYLSVLTLSTDKADALAFKYKTLFEQSDKIIRLSAMNFDEDGNIVESSQIVTKANMNLIASGLFNEDGTVAEGAGLITKKDVSALFAIDENGVLQSFIGASTEGIKLKASSISLEGLVTANGGFSIREDGSIVAVSGKIGNLILEGGSLKSDNMLLSNNVLRFNNEHGNIYLNGHPDTVTGGEAKLGTFIVKGGLYGGLKSTNKVALICSAPTTRKYDFDFYNSYAIWACGTSVFGGVSLRDRQGVRSGEVTITPDDSVLLIDGDVTLNADEVLAKSGIVHTLLIVNVGEGKPTLHGTEGRDRVIRFRNKCCKVVAYANGRWYPHTDYKD